MKKTLLSFLTLGFAACGAGSASEPQAPQLRSVEKMDGALMVRWTNVQTDCSMIEGERKAGTGDFAVVFTVPGEVNNKHDAAATSDTTYTYRLRCMKGAASSPYSAEMSMNPVR